MSRMTNRIIKAYSCAACGRPTSRLHGLAAEIRLPDDLSTTKVEVRGYCAAHREDVLASWDQDMAAFGTLIWSASQSPMALRPQDVEAFEAKALTDLAASWDVGGVDAMGRSICPHCGEPVSLGTGPHVDDVAKHPGTAAWQCHGCGAAGLLTLL
jgi:hypothetical protein